MNKLIKSITIVLWFILSIIGIVSCVYFRLKLNPLADFLLFIVSLCSLAIGLILITTILDSGKDNDILIL